MFRPLYWPSSGLQYALTYKETIQYNLYGVVGGGERDLVLQLVGRTECRNLGWSIDLRCGCCRGISWSIGVCSDIQFYPLFVKTRSRNPPPPTASNHMPFIITVLLETH
jgi:hypothetical protein